MLKPMNPPPAMVTASILERRGDTAALTRLQDTGGGNPSVSVQPEPSGQNLTN